MSSPLQDELRAELKRWEAAGLRRELALPEGIDFTSNNYLGLANDERLVAAAKRALEVYGVGAAAARLLRGNLAIHQQAEEAAATWLGTESSLLFPSGWQANQAALTTFTNGQDLIFSDALNHASLIDGARLSKASVEIFSHNDMEDLAKKLARGQHARRRLIVVESVYSMDGDLAPLDQLITLAERYDAHLYIDHAHGAGVFEDRYLQSDRILAQMVTGGKALGVGGAFICGSQTLVELLINRGRSFVFTTAVTPPTAAALVEAIKLVQTEPERATRVRGLATRLREKLQAHGIDAPGASPIVPVVLGSEDRSMAVAESIRVSGFDVRAIRPPTVPAGTSRLRIVCHANHTEEEIDDLAECIAQAVKGHPAETTAPMPASKPSFHSLMVCGTDTEVGKTVVSALLVRSLLRKDVPVRYLKPVQTGDDSDTVTVQALSALPQSLMLAPVVALPLPASVDQAAEDAGTVVRLEQVYQGVQSRYEQAPEAFWISECAGGLRVPYNTREDQADLLEALHAPVVLVARSALGTLNHTLLTVEAMAARKLKLAALFLVGDAHPANLKTLQRRLPETPIYELPRLEQLNTQALDSWLDNHPIERLFS
jgi:8-amino-7-oxononanoate synthase